MNSILFFPFPLPLPSSSSLFPLSLPLLLIADVGSLGIPCDRLTHTIL